MSKIAATVKVLMLSAFAALGAASAFAETETVNGYTWTYRINGDTVLKFGETPQWR